MRLFPSQHEAVRMLYKNHGLLSREVAQHYRALTVRTDDGSELEPELSFSYMEDFSPSSQVCTNVLTQLLPPREDACLVTWARSLTGSTTWCSWNAVVTLMLPRCCGCLRISQQFFLLFLEAISNTVPLGATRGLLQRWWTAFFWV